MRVSKLIEKALMLSPTLEIIISNVGDNVGDCITPYKVEIRHYSATTTATSHSLAVALAVAMAAMEENYPIVAERLKNPCIEHG